MVSLLCGIGVRCAGTPSLTQRKAAAPLAMPICGRKQPFQELDLALRARRRDDVAVSSGGPFAAPLHDTSHPRRQKHDATPGHADRRPTRRPGSQAGRPPGTLRAEIEAKLNTQDDPALMGLRNRMEETDDWAVADLETAHGRRGSLARRRRTAARSTRRSPGSKDGTYGTCLECGAPIPFGAPRRLSDGRALHRLPGTAGDGDAARRRRAMG